MSLSELQNAMSDVQQTEEKDTLGGGVLDGNVYDCAIDVAYTLKAASGALGFFIVFKDGDGNKLTDRQYITSGDKKGNKPYYERDGKKLPLPGFSHVDFLCQLVLNKSVTQLQQESAVLKLYNADEQKEVPTEVHVYPELRNIKVKVGLTKVRENKTKKEGNTYINLPEERFVNEFNKFFDFDTGKTKTELAGNTEASFINSWKEKFANQVVDNYKPVNGSGPAATSSSGGNAVNPFQQSGQTTPATDLFKQS